MRNESLLGSRISRYATLAVGGLGAAANADIRSYDIPIPIPSSSGNPDPVALSNAGLAFQLQIRNSSWYGKVDDGRTKSCCSFSSGGKICNSYGMVGPVNISSSGSVIVSCYENPLMVGVQRANEGDLNSGSWTATDPTSCGFVSYFWVVNETQNHTCDGVTTNADDYDASFYLRFEVQDPKTADTYFGWMLIEPLEGTGGDYQISRWAFEDSGAPIVVGDGPEPVTCNDADINGDGKVDSAALGLLIAAWGECK